jgi:hypothetical protein
MEIEDWTLKEFRRHAKKYWPKACEDHELPIHGCMPAVKDWLAATGIGIPAFIDKVKTAAGDRAWALYYCAEWGWIPRAEAVQLIKSAPGNQAMALYYCAASGWIPRAEAVPLIKTAPGNRECVLQWCADQGWITKAEAQTYLEAQC